MVFQDKSRDYNHVPLFSKRAPDNDTFTRDICDTCGFIDYVNPKIVAGVVALWEGKILMCRRDIEPRKGFWDLQVLTWIGELIGLINVWTHYYY